MTKNFIQTSLGCVLCAAGIEEVNNRHSGLCLTIVNINYTCDNSTLAAGYWCLAQSIEWHINTQTHQAPAMATILSQQTHDLTNGGLTSYLSHIVIVSLYVCVLPFFVSVFRMRYIVHFLLFQIGFFCLFHHKLPFVLSCISFFSLFISCSYCSSTLCCFYLSSASRDSQDSCTLYGLKRIQNTLTHTYESARARSI